MTGYTGGTDMDQKMFCYQCEQTAHCSGCTLTIEGTGTVYTKARQ